MAELRTRIAHSLRRHREAAGISVSELARRSGISKATVSQLENGSGNPSVETLWALGDALGIPFADLVDEPVVESRLVRLADLGGVPRVPSSDAPYIATLLSASPPSARRDLYLIQAEPGGPRRSLPHRAGTTEHVVLVAGAARVGPPETAESLSPGDYITYRGDAPHVFEALEPGTVAVLVSEQR